MKMWWQVSVGTSAMDKGLSKQGQKQEARAMPGRRPPLPRPRRRHNSDEVPSRADSSSDSLANATLPVPAASSPSSTSPDGGKAQFVWCPPAQEVSPASPNELSTTEISSPVSKILKFSYRPPAPLPDLSESSTSSPPLPKSSKAKTLKSPDQFTYRSPAAARQNSSSLSGTHSVSSTPPKSVWSSPSVSTSVNAADSQNKFVYRPQAPPSTAAGSSQANTSSASPSPAPSSAVSNADVRKVRVRCSKCGRRSHLWQDCPDDRKCARCSDPDNKQPCATVVIRTRMMKDCRDNGDLPQMRSILRSLKSDGHKPTVHSYSLLLSLLVSKGQMQEALKVRKDMEEDGVVPDTICYNTLLNGWCSAGKLEEAKAVLKDMRERKFQLTTSTYNTLIKGFGLAGQAAEAMKLLQQMTAEGVAKPNKQTFNILINAWAQVKDVEQARRVLQLMRNAGVSPDVVTYNTIAKAYAELRRSFEAERVINEMKDSYIRPNERTYGIVINSYCETGRPEEGLALLDRMKMDGVRCNLAIYNILIKGFAELHQPKNIEKVLDLMGASGVKPDVQSFSLIMNVWCSSGLVEEARNILQRMQKVYDLRPDVMAYTILAKGYVRARRPAEAEGVLSEMMSQGLKPNVFTYTTVISGWCNVGNMDDAFRIFNHMQTCGVPPNSSTVNTLIWGFSESKQPQRAEEVLEAMKRTGFKPDRKCLELVAEAWRLVGLPAEAKRVLRGEGTAADAVSDESSLRARFDSMTARREVVLDANIHKKLSIDPELAKRISSRSPTHIAINSMYVAAKSRQQMMRRPKTCLTDARRKIQAFKVGDMLFARRMVRLKSAASACLESQYECRVKCRVEKMIRRLTSAGAFSARTSFSPVIIF